ncbi:hypothetical protein [uncultured Gemmiger sp.]|uniref:hypothetical protein n=1 Tax=uncultured Gemmiger sp. TaxID=1623490 RepID=UPI0025FFB4F9|nr:hypothetical protein [uncultured Gemmiger sp.]
MKETKTKKSTYLRNFIIAVTLSAAILAAGALWVLLGWRSALDVTLTDLAGDPAALRGFTMRGQSYFDCAHTYWDLHDGYLDTSFALDPDESDNQYHYSAWGASIDTLYAVAPKSRDAVNAEAQRVHAYQDTYQMQSTASDFRVMAQIDIGGGILRIALRDVVLDAPISVSANAEVPTYLNRTSASYDYTADFSDEVEDTNTDYCYIAGQIFSLGNGQGLAWRYTVADRKAGLYKATPISYDDLAALPADGKVGDRDVLCATTEFGTLEPFYCPENARQVVCGLPMDDGLTLCVYLDPLNKACADLVNAAGEQVDHIDLGIEGGNGDFSVTVLPRTTDRDAVLKVDYRNILVALRVQDGKFILNKSLSIEGNIDLNSVDLYMRNAEDAVLNTAGDALLIATPEYTTVGEEKLNDSSNTYQTGTLLVVYPLDGSAPRYRGRLDNGVDRDWGGQLGESYYSWPAHHYMNYELYEKDREKRL